MAEIKPKTNEIIEQTTISFAESYVGLLRQKKLVDSEIKNLKRDYKMEGVDIPKVCKAINKVKANLKQTEIARAEDMLYEEMIEGSVGVMSSLNELVADDS